MTAGYISSVVICRQRERRLKGNKVRVKEDSRKKREVVCPLPVHSMKLVITNYGHKVSFLITHVNTFLKKEICGKTKYTFVAEDHYSLDFRLWTISISRIFRFKKIVTR